MELEGKWKTLVYVIIAALAIGIVLGGAHMIRSFDAPPEDYIETGLEASQLDWIEVELGGEKKTVVSPEEMGRIVEDLRGILYAPNVRPTEREKLEGQDMTITLGKDGGAWKTVRLLVGEDTNIWVKGGKKMRKAQWAENSLAFWNELSDFVPLGG